MRHTAGMPAPEEVWIPLVDEPIGTIVSRIQAEDPAIAALVDSPRRILAFRTFAYIRVGILLGELLVDNEVPEYDGADTWVESLLRDPAHRDAVHAEVRAVAEEIAADTTLGEDESIGPDDSARERFREFARKHGG
jgi:hypothetical protein